MSILFDDGIDIVSVPDCPVLRNMQIFTISFWMNPAGWGGSNLGQVLDKTDGNITGLSIALVNDSGQQSINANRSDGGSQAVNSSITLNAWQHITVTFNWNGDKKIHIYKNGVELSYVFNIPASVLENDTGFPLDIGQLSYINNQWFNGYIAEVAIWNTVLNQQEITQVATSGNGVGSIAPLNLIGYWPLCNTANPSPDISGQNNPGKVTLNPAETILSHVGPASPGRVCGRLATGSTTNLVNNDNANVGVTVSGVVLKNPNKGQF